MKRASIFIATALGALGAIHVAPALAEAPASLDSIVMPTGDGEDAVQRRYPGPAKGKEAHKAIFLALKDRKWDEARGRIAALDKDDPVRFVALSELYTDANSPRTELFDLLDLLNKASWLPDADQLSRMAQKRGAQSLPGTPQTQQLVWLGSSSRREYVKTTQQDAVAVQLIAQLLPFIKNDDPAGAERLLSASEAGLSPDGLAEARARVAWSYYIENDDANAARMASSALQAGSSGDWTTQAWWTSGLAAWRRNDPRAAAAAFQQVAGRADNDDMRAAGAFWAARAYMNAGDPARVEPLLRTAAQKEDTFYGLLARETLGLRQHDEAGERTAWDAIRKEPAVKAALALKQIGEDDLAADLVRRQAELSGARQYRAVLALAADLGLAQTQLWLSHHGPAGQKPGLFDRFPIPAWEPQNGWRVDPALIYAHALQESGFRESVVSPAGARGLMQVMPGTARMMLGASVDSAELNNPSFNMELGQRYLEQLRDMSATGGLLPKIMAAYNAGPAPVERWNTEVRDNGDPLLFIESVPYYETRAYVNIVMRNYWMYQLQTQGRADALTVMAQGQWPRFPKAPASYARRKPGSRSLASAE